jgi:ABC-type uncharacterized transport system auxiliary subunit
MNTKSVFALLAGLAVVWCTGCGKQAFDRQRYALIVQRPDMPSPVRTQTMLEVRPFSIDAAFATRSLTYRRTENRFETEFYHEYLAGLGAMITDQTRRWLEDSGIFSAVFTSGSLLRPTCTLEGNIAAAYLDTSKQGSSVARLEIAFYLLQKDTSNPSLIFGKRYTAEQPVDSSKIEAYMNAQHQCLTRILTDLENDLANLAKTQFKNGT